MPRKYRSRLARTERKRKACSAFLYFLFSVALLLAAIFLGIPFIIRFSSFISELRTPQELIETKDNFAPQSPIFAVANMATFSAQIDIKGFAEPGATVILRVNGPSRETVADNEGSFLFEKIDLEEGENHIKAIAVDQAGNESQESKILLITYDHESPQLAVDSPEDGATFKEEKIQVRGITDKDAKVTINDHFVMINSEGVFDYSLKLSEGENKIKIVATDQAGNRTEIEKVVEFNS